MPDIGVKRRSLLMVTAFFLCKKYQYISLNEKIKSFCKFLLTIGAGVIIFPGIFRSDFKNPYNAQIRRCEFLRNAHILACMLRFLRTSRLVFERDLGF